LRAYMNSRLHVYFHLLRVMCVIFILAYVSLFQPSSITPTSADIGVIIAQVLGLFFAMHQQAFILFIDVNLAIGFYGALTRLIIVTIGFCL